LKHVYVVQAQRITSADQRRPVAFGAAAHSELTSSSSGASSAKEMKKRATKECCGLQQPIGAHHQIIVAKGVE